jgi:hypothetical protein
MCRRRRMDRLFRFRRKDEVNIVSLVDAFIPLGLRELTSVKPFNLFDVVRGNLRQHVAVSRIDFSHGCSAFLADAHVGFVDVFIAHASRKVHDANANTGKRHGSKVVAIPVTVADAPVPRHLV